MIVGRAAEGFEIYRVVARVTAQEVGGQRLRSVEIQPGVLVNLRDARICVRDAARESRRVLRGFGEEEAVRNRVEVDVFRQMARERADIADAQHRIESEVMLHLQAEALHVRDVAAEIGAANRAQRSERRYPRLQVTREIRVPAGGDSLEGAEIEAWVDEGRRLLNRREDHVVARYAVVTDAVTAAYNRLLITEQIVGEA